MSSKTSGTVITTDQKSRRRARKIQPGRSRRQRALTNEVLEGRIVLTALVADVLAGTVDTAVVAPFTKI